MKYKKMLLATDIDGTLLKTDKTISIDSKKVIHQMIDLGHYFVIATGRPFHRIEQIIDELDLKSNNNYCICFNGGLITTTDGSKTIYECLLTDEEVIKLVGLASKLKVAIMVYLKDIILVNQIPEVVSSLKKLQCIKVVDGGYSFLSEQKNVYKIIYVGSSEEIDRVKNEIPTNYYQQFNITRSSSNFLEIMSKSVSKGNGLKKIATYLNVDMENTIAVGDEENDLSMILAAKVGCAVSNANRNLKKEADFITKSNDEDGVRNVIEQFILCEE